MIACPVLFSHTKKSTVSDKIFATNSSFYTTAKVQIFFRRFLLILTKVSLWEEDWALGYKNVKLKIFLTFPNFLRFLILNRFTNHKSTRNNHALFLLCKKEIWSNIKKSALFLNFSKKHSRANLKGFE